MALMNMRRSLQRDPNLPPNADHWIALNTFPLLFLNAQKWPREYLKEETVDIGMVSEKDKEELKTSAASIASGTTAVSTAKNPQFIASKSLFINTRGISVLRLPLPPSKLEIGIYNTDGFPAFQST